MLLFFSSRRGLNAVFFWWVKFFKSKISLITFTLMSFFSQFYLSWLQHFVCAAMKVWAVKTPISNVSRKKKCFLCVLVCRRNVKCVPSSFVGESTHTHIPPRAHTTHTSLKIFYYHITLISGYTPLINRVRRHLACWQRFCDRLRWHTPFT